MGKQTTDEYPAHLDRAQRALAAVQAERRAFLAFLASLGSWGGDLETAKAGLGRSSSPSPRGWRKPSGRPRTRYGRTGTGRP